MTTRSPVRSGNAASFSNADLRELFGWCEYADQTYTEGSPLSITANTDTVIENDGAGGVKSYAPSFDLYDSANDVITGREGETRLITFECSSIPRSAQTTYMTFFFDIGGSIQPIYTRPITFPKGNGVLRPIVFTTLAYTLNTWEQNGALLKCNVNGALDIFNARYVIKRDSPII